MKPHERRLVNLVSASQVLNMVTGITPTLVRPNNDKYGRDRPGFSSSVDYSFISNLNFLVSGRFWVSGNLETGNLEI